MLLSAASIWLCLCCSTLALYSTIKAPVSNWAAPSLEHRPFPLETFPLCNSQQQHLTKCFQQYIPSYDDQQRCDSPPAKQLHNATATRASAAFQKIKQLFDDDMQFALGQNRSASESFGTRIAATSSQSQHSMTSVTSQQCIEPSAKQRHGVVLGSPLAASFSSSSANSLPDPAGRYHGYAGISYQSGKLQHPFPRLLVLVCCLLDLITCPPILISLCCVLQAGKTLTLLQISVVIALTITKGCLGRSMFMAAYHGRIDTSRNRTIRNFKGFISGESSSCRNCIALTKASEN